MTVSRSEILKNFNLAVSKADNEAIPELRKQVDAAVCFTNNEYDKFATAVRSGISLLMESWRVVSEREQESEGNDKAQAQAKVAREQIELDVKVFCREIRSLVDQQLKVNGDLLHRIAFGTLSGDVYAALQRITYGDDREPLNNKAQMAYQVAFDEVKSELPAIDPYRLKLALDFSIFYYVDLNSPDSACHLAKQAFDDATGELESVLPEQKAEVADLMQQLRDKLTLWTSDAPDADQLADNAASELH